MSDEKYDPFVGIYRIAGAAENLDIRVVEVLALHYALEREIDVVLAKLVVRSSKLLSIGFVNKSKFLHAVWPESVDADRLFNVLNSFNELRNAFAHGNSDGISARHANLLSAYLQIEPEASEPIGYNYIAQGICAFMGSGPMPVELQKLNDGLAKILEAWGEPRICRFIEVEKLRSLAPLGFRCAALSILPCPTSGVARTA